jgi:hypothetical protein
MNQLKYIFYLLALVLIGFSCSDDELDADELTNLPPGIVSISPDRDITFGYFDVVAVLADGANSPLSSATITLLDEFGNLLGTVTEEVSGLQDTIMLPGTDFNAELLGAGNYVIELSAIDMAGNEVNRTVNFAITLSEFTAVHSEMYIAGAFNGWGADVMELVDNNTWEITVDLQGEAWKFKNCEDWCDEDWGDTNCDGIMESNMSPDGNGDTDCGFTGMAIISFNDLTLEYTVRPAVEFATNLSGLYLMGDFNGFEGGEYRFSLVEDNTWVLAEVPLEPGQKFRFAEMPNFMGKNYGDVENDGIAEEFSEANAVLPEDLEPGFYSFTFNDASLAYSYEFVRPPTGIESVGILGAATAGGWDVDQDLSDDDGDGIWTGIVGVYDGEVKFRANDEWTINWGSADFPSGIGVQEGDNIIATAGIYNVSIDVVTGEYNFELLSVGILGSATPGGWDVDQDMMQNDTDPNVVQTEIDLIDGESKFRANDDWAINWGAADFPTGIATQDGPNIPTPAGTYNVTLNVYTGEYNFE